MNINNKIYLHILKKYCRRVHVPLLAFIYQIYIFVQRLKSVKKIFL